MSNETVVTHTPRSRVMLNESLIKEKGLSEDTVEMIIDVHELLDYVLNNPEEYDDPVALVEQYEFWLQEFWGFSRDRNYHIHWVRTKGCTCPKADNRLWAGLDARFLSMSCPWHSKQYKGEKN